MTKKEINSAMTIANSQETLSEVDISIFDGFGLPDFKPVNTTLRQVARLIRWQCFLMNGELDAQKFNELCYFAKQRFSIFGN